MGGSGLVEEVGELGELLLGREVAEVGLEELGYVFCGGGCVHDGLDVGVHGGENFSGVG